MADTPTPPHPDAMPPEPAAQEPAAAEPATAEDVTAERGSGEEPTAVETTAIAPSDSGGDGASEEQTAAAPVSDAAPATPPETTPAPPQADASAAAPAAPEPEPEAQPLPPVAGEPSVAATLIAPPAGSGGEPGSEGGEWELLLDKLNGWLRGGRIQEQLSASRRPITLVASLIGLLLVLRVYHAVLGAIDSLPLVPGLLELAGLIALVHFSFTRLVRSRERQRLIAGLQQRWQDFTGGAG